MTTGHPSFFVQDEWAAGLTVPAGARAHLEACIECTARAESLRAPEPVPGWVRALAAAPPRPPTGARSWVWLSGAGALAAAAIVLLVAAPPPDRRAAPAWTTIRGAPAVGVYVKRGPSVSLWDGRQPLAPGDRLRLKVVAEGFTHVSVFSPASAGSSGLRLLHGSRVDPGGETLLPPAWRVDAAPGDEVLVVVLANREVSAGEVPRADSPRRPDLWVRWLRLPKTIGGSR